MALQRRMRFARARGRAAMLRFRPQRLHGLPRGRVEAGPAGVEMREREYAVTRILPA
jgi:hypothetical protein